VSATALREEAERIAAEAATVHHDTLAEALVAALARLTVVEAARTADTGSYSYRYADLGDIIKKTRPVLAEHGVVALTPLHEHGTGLAVSVILLHTSGQKLHLGPFPFPHGRDSQATGSMVTYMRRYALSAALGIAAGDDDDGASAKASQRQQEANRPWSKGGTKNRLLSLLDGNEADAAACWEYVSGDAAEGAWGEQWCKDAVDQWKGRPMTDDPAPDPVPEQEGDPT
jgi:hypothetical protein